jgi:hypothetical protein
MHLHLENNMLLKIISTEPNAYGSAGDWIGRGRGRGEKLTAGETHRFSIFPRQKHKILVPTGRRFNWPVRRGDERVVRLVDGPLRTNTPS